ncbi:jerky protein homolog-like [Bombus pascuorum]|uniref:jerky protein homolog-like n=1 Tax=Bombus pascuorum TaxID=65598 RepID=UPI00298ECD39|nr:jerky protein homolog-like [Bombus pascuorum]
MVPKRRRVNLTIAEKYDIIMLRDTGEDSETIMNQYDIAKSTLYSVYAQKDEVIKEFEMGTVGFSSATQRILSPSSADVDKVVFHWYLRCKERNVQMTGEHIKKKATEINEKLKVNPHFKANFRWFMGFKKRYRITNEDVREDMPSATKFVIGEKFTVDFNKFWKEKRLALKNVYNVVYIPIMWKAVPQKTSIWSNAKLTENLTMCEDYVVALFCANATGCHKLPVLMIGNIPETQRSYNSTTKSCSTIYKSMTNPCMDSTIFTQWYKDHFLESVKERQGTDEREKSLLLLDNAQSLHDVNALNEIDPLVTVMSPPVEVRSVKHPMHCGITTGFKRKYRKELLEAITPLPTCNTEKEVIHLHNQLSMWDCCRLVDHAWLNVEEAIIIHSWENLLQLKITGGYNMEYSYLWKADLLKTVELLHDLPGCGECKEVDVIEWFHIDDDYSIVDKICTDEVLEKFKNNSLGENLEMGNVEELAGPSRS